MHIEISPDKTVSGDSVNIIIDRETRRTLIGLSPANRPYFWYEFAFSHYEYPKIYDKKVQGLSSRVVRVYGIYLHLDIRVFHDRKPKPIVSWNLGRILGKILRSELLESPNSNINPSELSKIIDKLEHHPMQMINWKYYCLNNFYYFNFTDRQIHSASSVPSIKFRYSGGLIETNDINRLIDEHFIDVDQSTLVITTKSLRHLWGFSTRTMYYGELIDNMHDNNLEIFIKQNGHYDRIIIQECHSNFLPIIKTVANISNCQVIWVINSLPLPYYFGGLGDKISADDMISLLDLWADMDSDCKRVHKTDIYRFIYGDIRHLFININYKTINLRSYASMIIYKPTKLEESVYAVFNSYYFKWLHGLTCDPNNLYSMTEPKTMRKLQNKVYQATLQLLSSITQQSTIYDYYREHITTVLAHIREYLEEIEVEKNKWKAYNQVCRPIIGRPSIVNNRYYSQRIQQVEEKALILQKNYERYYEGSSFRLQDDCEQSICSICYTDQEEEDIIWVQFICGHLMCLNCALGSIRSNNSCPMCKEFINIQSMAIVLTANKSELIPDWIIYLRSLDNSNLIITDLTFLNYTNVGNATVVNIERSGINSLIRELAELDTESQQRNQTIQQIIIMTLPSNLQKRGSIRKINMLLRYLLINIGPVQIQEIQFALQ